MSGDCLMATSAPHNSQRHSLRQKPPRSRSHRFRRSSAARATPRSSATAAIAPKSVGAAQARDYYCPQMNPITIGREVASAWTLAASYPLECFTFLQIPPQFRRSRDAVILVHGHGGDRTNMLLMSLLLRMAGFDNIGFFAYPMRQSANTSAMHLAEMAAQADDGAGVHFVGHSLG